MEMRFSKYPAHYTILIMFFIAFINGFYIEWIFQTNLLIAWAYDILQFVVIPFSLFFILFKYYDITPDCYGILMPSDQFNRNTLIYNSIVSAIILVVFYKATYALVDRFVGDIPFDGYFNLIPEGLMQIPVIIYLSITAAIVEEIVFRGLPLFIFKKHTNNKYFNIVFVITTSVLFSSIHWESGAPDLAATFVFGVLAAILYLHYKNLIPLMFAHFVGDLVAFW